MRISSLVCLCLSLGNAVWMALKVKMKTPLVGGFPRKRHLFLGHDHDPGVLSLASRSKGNSPFSHCASFVLLACNHALSALLTFYLMFFGVGATSKTWVIFSHMPLEGVWDEMQPVSLEPRNGKEKKQQEMEDIMSPGCN